MKKANIFLNMYKARQDRNVTNNTKFQNKMEDKELVAEK